MTGKLSGNLLQLEIAKRVIGIWTRYDQLFFRALAVNVNIEASLNPAIRIRFVHHYVIWQHLVESMMLFN
jgi:hypothetical protein